MSVDTHITRAITNNDREISTYAMMKCCGVNQISRILQKAALAVTKVAKSRKKDEEGDQKEAEEIEGQGGGGGANWTLVILMTDIRVRRGYVTRGLPCARGWAI